MRQTFLSRSTGPDIVTEAFRRAFLSGRLAHAYLFVGPPGSGRKEFARTLAQALLCETGEPCGECSSCRSIAHDNHADLRVYSTTGRRASIDIEGVRELAQLDHRRHRGLRVWIVEDCERMAVPASNALLKTLEEPSSRTLLILIAPSTGSILPTLVSRCQRVQFPVRAAQSEAAGSEAAGSEAAAANELSRESLAAVVAPTFFADVDPRAWLDGVVSGCDSPRAAVAKTIDAVIARARHEWKRCEREGETSDLLHAIEQLLELRADVDANVNVDLLLESLLRQLRSAPLAHIVAAI